MKIAYVSDLDARNVRSWSGSTWHMWNGLAEAGADVELITPLNVPRKRWYAAVKHLWQALGKTYSHRGEPRVLRALAAQVQAGLRDLHGAPDVIFSCGKPPIAALETPIPMVFADDGSVPAITRLYPGMGRLTRRCVRQMLAAERGLLARVLMGTYASEWAADAARKAYPESASRVDSVPWGANIECRRTDADIETFIAARRSSGVFRVFFSGVDWKRKRGDLVVDACRLARARGTPVELDLAGCRPPEPLPDFVRVHGFISKSTAEGRKKIDRLYETADVLFVPSRAEAYGVVFAEAGSFGVPSLSTAVGGISSVVRDGVNGRLLPLQAGPEEYADILFEGWRGPERWATMARRSYRHYREHLTWKAFGTATLRQIEERLAQRG